MCIVSNVMDHFGTTPWPGGIDIRGTSSTGGIVFGPPQLSADELNELRAFIKEFRQAVTAAEFLDRIMKKPDCVDPEKAKLVERIAFLEAQLDAIKKGVAEVLTTSST